MKVSEAIDQLEVGDTVWVKSKVTAINFEGGYIRSENTKTSIYLDGDEEISLTEPQAEKVEVPQFAAELLDYYKGYTDVDLLDMLVGFNAWYCRQDKNGEHEEAIDWLVKNPEKFMRAWMDGYIVKQEPKWVVKDSGGDYVHDLRIFDVDMTVNGSYATKFDALTFNDRTKAEAVATLVEGTVEEV